jgi:16S rRNA (guanine966-N2)-methyltransferase
MKFNDEQVHFDLVLLDPPYAMKINKDIIETLAKQGNLNDGCTIVIEDLKEERIEVEAPFVLKKEKDFGITIMQILEYRGN